MPITGTPFAGVGVSPTITAANTSGLRTIVVTASEALADTPDLRDVASYTLTPNGGSVARAILSATPGSDPRTIILLVDGDLSLGAAAYTIEVDAAVTDLAGNGIAAPDSADVNVAAPSITSHCELALARLASQYREQPNFEALICGYADRWDGLESAFSDLAYFRGIERAFGIRLDWIAELYKVLREGRADEALRPILRGHARRVSARGTAEDILDVVRAALVGTGVAPLWTEAWPAGFIVTTDGIPELLARAVAVLVRRSKPQAVRPVLWWTPPGPLAFFGWADSVAPVGSTVTGWAGTVPPATDPSGVWARAS